MPVAKREAWAVADNNNIRKDGPQEVPAIKPILPGPNYDFKTFKVSHTYHDIINSTQKEERERLLNFYFYDAWNGGTFSLL